MTNKTISVIGLGKLGLPLAACLASAGLTVVGADVDPDKVRAVNDGVAPQFEPGLQELLQVTRQRLTATQSVALAVEATDITLL